MVHSGNDDSGGGEEGKIHYRKAVLNLCQMQVVNASHMREVELKPGQGLAQVFIDANPPFILEDKIVCAGLVRVHGLRDGTIVYYREIQH